LDLTFAITGPCTFTDERFLWRIVFFWNVTPRHWIIGSWRFEAMNNSHIQRSKCTMFFLDVSAFEEEGNMSLVNVRKGLPSEAASYHSAAETSQLAMFVVVYWKILNCIIYFVVL
jgi:hypothetical protein